MSKGLTKLQKEIIDRFVHEWVESKNDSELKAQFERELEAYITSEIEKRMARPLDQQAADAKLRELWENTK